MAVVEPPGGVQESEKVGNTPTTRSDRRRLSVLEMAAYTKTGVIGRSSLGTAAKGRATLGHFAAGAREILGILDGTSSDG